MGALFWLFGRPNTNRVNEADPNFLVAKFVVDLIPNCSNSHPAGRLLARTVPFVRLSGIGNPELTSSLRSALAPNSLCQE
jgi:hypothetical protein